MNPVRPVVWREPGWSYLPKLRAMRGSGVLSISMWFRASAVALAFGCGLLWLIHRTHPPTAQQVVRPMLLAALGWSGICVLQVLLFKYWLSRPRWEVGPEGIKMWRNGHLRRDVRPGDLIGVRIETTDQQSLRLRFRHGGEVHEETVGLTPAVDLIALDDACERLLARAQQDTASDETDPDEVQTKRDECEKLRADPLMTRKRE